MQQLKNYFTMLLLSAGTPMFVMGDEFGRTQGGLDNPYNIDSEVTWVDWSRLETWAELHDYVQDAAAPPACESADGFSLLRRRVGARHLVGVAFAGVVGRRPVRDGQCLVGAGEVRAAGARTVGDRPVVGTTTWHDSCATIDGGLASLLERHTADQIVQRTIGRNPNFS